MRYYYYIADSKVDMLLPQIPGAPVSEISSDIGFDLKVLKGSIKQKRAIPDDRVSRLQAVEAHLRREERSRESLDSNWFSGEMVGMPIVFNECQEAVFFWGSFEGQPLLLGGSARNLIGGEARQHVSTQVSFLPRLVSALLSTIHSEESTIMLSGNEIVPLHASVGPDENAAEAWRTVVVILNSKKLKFREEKLEFFARRLLPQSERIAFTLATPLFVAGK